MLVCELAGSYDLLVPLMLAEGIAFVALRKRIALPRAGADPARLAGAPGADVPDLLRSALVSAVMRPMRRRIGRAIAVPGDSADVDASAATIAVPPLVALRADDDLRAATVL